MSGHTVVDALLQRLAADADVLPLLEAWSAPAHQEHWRQDVRIHRGFAEALLRTGHPTRAYELACEGIAVHPGDRMLVYLSAQALVRGRNHEKASEYLEPLLAVPVDDLVHIKALSLAGRVKKDLCTQTDEPHVRRRFARESAQHYEAAFQHKRWSFPAINAATMWRVAGQDDRADELARAALELAGAERNAPDPDGAYWAHATIGEARLQLGDVYGAIAAYQEAVRLAGRRYGDVASMRANVKLLGLGAEPPERLLTVFDVGTAIAFAGHMLDHPDRRGVRFPADAELEGRVAAAIRAELDVMRPVVGYGAAACGADLMFCEALLERGAELHVVLPFERGDFYQTSVDFGLDRMRSWRQRFDAVLAEAAEVHYATREPYLGADALFGFGDSVARGMAINHAAQLGIEARAVVLIDPQAPVLANGTGAFAATWRKQGRPLHVIDLAALRSPGAPVRARKSKPRPVRRAREERRQIKSMLFADVKNFSKLPEALAPLFFVTFLAEVDKAIKKTARRPVFQNTWGDGLYLVFNQVTDCASFALLLLDRMRKVDWARVGLPTDTAVRIGLHSGPVYRGRDPIIGRNNFFGSHVTRAARIEPITPPGCAFASEQFAAALAAVTGHDLVCDYVGRQMLAKNADNCILYSLRRR